MYLNRDISALLVTMCAWASVADAQTVADYQVQTSDGQRLDNVLRLGPDRDKMIEHALGPTTDGAVTGAVIATSSSRLTNYGVGGFARSDFSGGGATANAVGVFSAAIVNADSAQAWAWNSITADYPDNRYLQTGTGRAIIGAEYDFATYSPNSTIGGVAVEGSAKAQPAGADGFSVGELSTQAPGTAKWTHGFVVNDGVVTSDGEAVHIGASTTSGMTQASHQIGFDYFDSSGVERAYQCRVVGSGYLSCKNTAGLGTAGLDLDGSATVRGGVTAAGAVYAGTTLQAPALPSFASESAAASAGLVCGMMFRIGTVVNIRATGC